MNTLLSLGALGLALTLAAEAAAQDKPTLTVYTYDSFVSEWGPGPVVEPRFEAVCGCDLNLVAAGDGAALLGRVQLEGAASEADLVLGLDTNLIAAATETGLFAPHGQPTDALATPGGWDDPLFLPYDWGAFAFVYDETRLREPPRSFEELVAAPENVTVVIQDPRTSTPGLGLLLWVKQVYGDEAGDFWRRLAPRIVTVTKGWWEAYSMFTEGEAMMALSYTTSPAYHVAVEDDRTKKAAEFSEGHYLQIEVAGKLAASDQPELAEQFLAFMLSEEFQTAIPTTNWMYPAVALRGGLPDSFDSLIEPGEGMLLDPAEVPAAREAALAEWLDALSR